MAVRALFLQGCCQVEFGIFLLHCCAHHDDGDSLGNDDELVHPTGQKKGKASQTKNNTNNKPPHQKKQTETKQNNQKPGDPNEGETVKQIWPSMSEDPSSQDICGGLGGVECCKPYSN